ncbi:unnamed protein product [Allacma fusca]|uniref:Uncharacterized protein n=1 Tax=Allacma fusca TaxID=39272 RepID=A0A8J2PDZ9_9HEXA|nr:unnamed protein product [Allacma fusca]
MKLLCGFLLLAVVAVMSIQAHEGLHFRRNIAQVAEQDLSSEASTAKLLEVPEKRGTKWEELRNTRARLDARRENEPKLQKFSTASALASAENFTY